MGFYNRTRRAASFPVALLQRGRVLELPLYYALRASDLAREGFENSGSFRFADHIYRSHPSGRGAFGRWLDARLLAMPAVQSFRNRYRVASEECYRCLWQRAGAGAFAVLSVPCGIPREMVEAASQFRREGGSLDGVHLHAFDLDPEVLREAEEFAAESGLELVTHQGDAFDATAYDREFDLVTSTGFGEFLDDAQLESFYRVLWSRLRPGGTLFSSAMQRRWLSAYLLRLAELRVHYRNALDLARIARAAGFTQVETWSDEYEIQSFLRARR